MDVSHNQIFLGYKNGFTDVAHFLYVTPAYSDRRKKVKVFSVHILLGRLWQKLACRLHMLPVMLNPV